MRSYEDKTDLEVTSMKEAMKILANLTFKAYYNQPLTDNELVKAFGICTNDLLFIKAHFDGKHQFDNLINQLCTEVLNMSNPQMVALAVRGMLSDDGWDYYTDTVKSIVYSLKSKNEDVVIDFLDELNRYACRRLTPSSDDAKFWHPIITANRIDAVRREMKI